MFSSHLGCDSTHYGLNCTKKCSVNCTIGCTKDTGVCYSCVEGKFGEYCDKKCGIGCVSGCDQYSGQCVCKHGWQSDRCEGKLLRSVIMRQKVNAQCVTNGMSSHDLFYLRMGLF